MKAPMALLLLAAPLAAAPTIPCGLTIAPFLDFGQGPMGADIRQDCYYSLSLMRAFQKVPGGYLIAPEGYAVARPALAYLETDEDLGEGLPMGGYAYRAGLYTYTELSGFERTVYKLKRASADDSADRKAAADSKAWMDGQTQKIQQAYHDRWYQAHYGKRGAPPDNLVPE